MPSGFSPSQNTLSKTECEIFGLDLACIYSNQTIHQTGEILLLRWSLQPRRPCRRPAFCAGQIPIDSATGNLVSDDVEVQTERMLLNVKAIPDGQKLVFVNL